MKKRGEFDSSGFYQALDAARQSRDMTWRKVAGEAGISASTLTRMAQGKRPDVDSLAALTAWSGLRADDFVRPAAGAEPQPDPLATISTCLRRDPNLTPEAAAALDEMIKALYERVRKGRD